MTDKLRCRRCGDPAVHPNKRDVLTCRRCGHEQEDKCPDCQGPAARGDHEECKR